MAARAIHRWELRSREVEHSFPRPCRGGEAPLARSSLSLGRGRRTQAPSIGEIVQQVPGALLESGQESAEGRRQDPLGVPRDNICDVGRRRAGTRREHRAFRHPC